MIGIVEKIKRSDLSPNDKAVLALTWKYFAWGALAGVILALVWNRSFDFWTLLGGAVFGIVLTILFLAAIAFDVIRFPGGDDKP